MKPVRTSLLLILGALLALLVTPGTVTADQDAKPFHVTISQIADQKAVFGTVESLKVTPARARLSGTLAELAVSEGDRVTQGQVLAVITDDKLALRIQSVNARIKALLAQKENADTELSRAKDLFARGIIPKSRYDAALTNANVISNQRKSARADRNVLTQQVREGKVLAPASGRVLTVPVATGEVILPGEPLATIAAENYILRLALPERHARFVHTGDTIRVDASLVDGSASRTGTITKVYPQISDGRVLADATVDGLGDYFVGERVRVWVSTVKRDRILVPASYVSTRFGVDYVRVLDHGEPRDVVVQRGIQSTIKIDDDTVPALEILTGLADGDELVAP
ncbi:MAG: efflux transporter periplasmic adaptor subunit [Robiginitomaculum sp.]|nr:MAG: efflux transporter periplasmic adaptor subunit [Robiginitomaculum sp.]